MTCCVIIYLLIYVFDCERGGTFTILLRYGLRNSIEELFELRIINGILNNLMNF